MALLAACEADKPQPVDAGSNYFPLTAGVYQIYDVQEVNYAPDVEAQVTTYQLKMQVADSFATASGGITYVIYRSTRDEESGEWRELDTWSARKDDEGQTFADILNEVAAEPEQLFVLFLLGEKQNDLHNAQKQSQRKGYVGEKSKAEHVDETQPQRLLRAVFRRRGRISHPCCPFPVQTLNMGPTPMWLLRAAIQRHRGSRPLHSP